MFSEESGERGAPGITAEIPLQSVVQTMVKQMCSCRQWRIRLKQISTCSLWRTSYRSRWMPERGCDPVDLCRSRFVGRTCGHMKRGPRVVEGLLVGFMTPCEGPKLEQFGKSSSPCEGLMLEMFTKDCLL
ncbi:hypothetical protein TURU_101897 [Turdus rufiventris]|nr:hypothetical protein TURU_101897 [Turdus rufiventris]